MPAIRTRKTKKEVIDGGQLTWDIPANISPPLEQCISFTANMTPINYNDPPPPLVDAPTILFPPSPEGVPGRRAAHSKKKAENHIPRPPNAFILFRSSFIKSQHVSTEVETNHSTLSKIIGLTWQNLPNEERQVWHAKAKAALDDHKRRFPSYAFRPAHTRGKGGTEKRKVREVGLKDTKRCEKIAELLVEGKKGEDLDAAIQEFDRTHVPEVITRFEAPLTARMYRRSSSAPAGEPEPKPFLRASPRSQRVRAASTQPTRVVLPALCVDTTPVELCPENFFQASFESGYATSEFSFDQKIEPASFNFNPFYVDEANSPYDSPISAMDTGLHMFSQDMLPPALSINTTFAQWDPPSPFDSTPSTPQLYSHQSPYSSEPPTSVPEDTFAMPNFNIDSFDHLSPFDHSIDMTHNGFLSSDFASMPKPRLASLDSDFSAFMSSLHASAYTI